MGPRKFEEVRSFLSGFVYVSLALIGKKTFHPMAKNLVFPNWEIFRGIQYTPFPEQHKYLGIGDIGQNLAKPRISGIFSLSLVLIVSTMQFLKYPMFTPIECH
jgi:hypothetical protein